MMQFDEKKLNEILENVAKMYDNEESKEILNKIKGAKVNLIGLVNDSINAKSVNIEAITKELNKICQQD